MADAQSQREALSAEAGRGIKRGADEEHLGRGSADAEERASKHARHQGHVGSQPLEEAPQGRWSSPTSRQPDHRPTTSSAPRDARSFPPTSSSHMLPARPQSTVEASSGSPSAPNASPFVLSRPRPQDVAGIGLHRGVLQQPTQVASFSYDEERRIQHDDRSRAWYRCPPVGADLNHGFDRATWRDESQNEHLDGMLYSLMHRCAQIPAATRPGNELHLPRYDVITWRGIVTRLSTSLYEERGSGWELNAMLLGETLYLEEHVSGERREEKRRDMESSRNRLFTYYGYAFESYGTSSEERPSPQAPSWNGDVNTNVQWCSIVRTKLESRASGSHRLLFGGEVDCISRSRDGRKEMVELKTSMSVRRHVPRDLENLHRKMLGWHFQSYLLGVGRIVVGFRNRDGFVESVEEFDTLQLPRLAGGMWDPSASLSFANDTIAFIKRSIRSHLEARQPSRSEEPPVFRIRFAPPFQRITLVPLDEEGVAEVKGTEMLRVGFLPLDYYEFVKAQEGGAEEPRTAVTTASHRHAYEY